MPVRPKTARQASKKAAEMVARDSLLAMLAFVSSKPCSLSRSASASYVMSSKISA